MTIKPPIKWLLGAGAAGTALYGGYKLYKWLKGEAKQTYSNFNHKQIAFLGQAGAGKTTICQILSTGDFKEEWEATPDNKYSTCRDMTPIGIRACPPPLLFIDFFDTQGSFGEQISKAKEERAECIYVLNMKDYMGERKEEIEREIRDFQKYGSKVIGTHKDEVENCDDIANEIRKNLNVEFKIWDLTRAKTDGAKVKGELLDFMVGSIPHFPPFFGRPPFIVASQIKSK